MIVRKLTFAPDEAGPQPTTEITRDFIMSLGSLRVEASLDKQVSLLFSTFCSGIFRYFWLAIKDRLR